MKVLKEDNPLYGKKGTKITDTLLQYIPSKHHQLFEEVPKNKSFEDGSIEHHLYQAMVNGNRFNPGVIEGNPVPDIVEGLHRQWMDTFNDRVQLDIPEDLAEEHDDDDDEYWDDYVNDEYPEEETE